MRTYQAIALALAAVFAFVGLVFTFTPGLVAALFGAVSATAAIPGLPAGDVSSGLFRALAGAYMYLVALVAWMMFRRPAELVWPTILAHAKLASATLSLLLCLVDGPTLVLAANAIVDGLIGALAIRLRRLARAGCGDPGEASAQ